MTTALALSILRAEHRALLSDVSDGNRVFWVGSGLSRGVVPMLPELIYRVLGFLQANAAEGDSNDPHLATLEALVARHLPLELANLKADPKGWALPTPSELEPLARFYADIFAERVPGKDPDYILWNAVDVPHTFGDPSLTPSSNHILLALLMLEGVVSEVASGNWDGLIEKAVANLNANAPSELAVLITNESFRVETGTIHLYKFHGCAVKALNSPNEYRPLLIGRSNDIAGWPVDPRFNEVRVHMSALARIRPTLFLGLSVQDYNLMMTLIGAGVMNPWPWDESHPAYLFSEISLTTAQTGLLEKLYPSEYVSDSAEIDARSALGMYSLDVLSAVALHVVSEKIRRLSARSKIFADDADRESSTSDGSAGLETEFARVGSEALQLLELLTGGLSSTVAQFTGDSHTTAYQPIFSGPAHQATTSSQPDRDATTELAAILTVLGLGAASGRWQLSLLGTPGQCGFVKVKAMSGGSDVLIAIVRDVSSANTVLASSEWATSADRLLLLQTSGSGVSNTTRSVARGLGSGRSRSGKSSLWVDDFLRDRNSSAAVLSQFAEAIGA